MRALTRSIQVRMVTLVGAMAAMGRSSPARALPSGDAAAAEQLFERGKALIKEGDWAAGCAKLQASMELDPAVGTLLKLAKCHEHEGKLARASADYEAALDLNRQRVGQTEARRAELAEFATNALAALRPRIPRLRIVIPEKPPGLRVTRDGQALSEGALDEELPVDPGPVEIVVKAPGYVTVRRTEVAVEGQLIEAAIVLTPKTFRLVPPEAPPPPPPDTRRTTALYMGTGGIVILAIAAGFGVDTLIKVHASSPFCDATNHCLQDGYDLRNAARASQTRGLVALGLGALLLGTGIVVLATAPSIPAAPRAELAASPSWVGVRGTW